MKEVDLGKENINKLLISFAVPCIISMLINSIYNIVDQIFIGQGVGYLGNAATNVIFPLVIICNSIAQLFGNGCAAGLSLKLGEGKREEAKKQVGSTITLLVVIAIIFSIIAYFVLPKLVYFFGCSKNVYPYALKYGKIIAIGAPFMIIYTALSSIIRADGSPKYSMVCLLVGAIINIILDPIFIFGLKMGVEGGALATIIGQIISFIIAFIYIPKIKSVKLEKRDFKVNKFVLKSLSYGLSSFITQMTILTLFIYMNNIMTKYGELSKFGADIPLSVYGVISKLNGLYVSSVLGIAIGSQPIIGFNYGAKKYDRVKQTLKKVLKINFIIGFVFNILMLLFPKQIVSLFGSANDKLYLEFATDFCKIFLSLAVLNAFEMTSSIVIQSLGNVKKATFVAFARQIILFIPISLLLTKFIGLYGTLYGGPIADAVCFIIVIFIFSSEYKKIGHNKFESHTIIENSIKNNYKIKQKIIITINREFGSGGRYIGRLLAEELGIKFYDKEFVKKAATYSGFDEEYIEANEQKRKWGSNLNSEYNGEDKIFEVESKIVKEISNESCVIIGRCASHILKDNNDVFKVFIFSNMDDKVNRAVKYYGINRTKAEKEIIKENKLRAKHYKYYTGEVWNDPNNYDICINSKTLGIDDSVKLLKEAIMDRFEK